ncbi:non-homologous end-joining DNA ligase [Streptomyces sp. YIM 98790]|uniref:non-homologous end-joining DNA ligase n=1 Tax=Streptomyces sp. YIM 98790 TaxID=2689077 RepID=UPI00140A4567|nr:non-homologous end-joining DNA ligase [Streptomyces sp. YIM 98790]
MTVTEVEGRRLSLSNLDKVIYPDTGTTKGELLHYYAVHAGVLLPHLRDRTVSFLRYPDGPAGQMFFTKNLPPGTPDWVATAEVPSWSASEGRQVVIQDLPSLVWAANLVVEFHIHQWPAATPATADRLILDLDPGAPADITDCCRVAGWLRDRLTADGLTAFAKTSGSKGLHLVCPLAPPAPSEKVSAYAKALARSAQSELHGKATAVMARRERAGKVFIDWSQNAAAKTTAAPYTVRARATPGVSTPVTWGELADCTGPEQLRFELPDLPARLERHGDPMAGLLNPLHAAPLPPA